MYPYITFLATSKNVCNNRRTVNFTRNEENALLLLVKKYADIIENKKTDSSVNHKKTETWMQIEKEFNYKSEGTYRSASILKNKYLNLKKRSVKNFSNEKKHLYGTGGGPPVIFNPDDIDSNIKEIIGTRMTGFESQFDSDNLISLVNNIIIKSCMSLQPININIYKIVEILSIFFFKCVLDFSCKEPEQTIPSETSNVETNARGT